jgi:hypothetical protein
MGETREIESLTRAHLKQSALATFFLIFEAGLMSWIISESCYMFEEQSLIR